MTGYMMNYPQNYGCSKSRVYRQLLKQNNEYQGDENV